MSIILDSSIGYYIDKIDVVLLGALCVAQSGGVINKIGSYPLALLAHTKKKPVYITTGINGNNK